MNRKQLTQLTNRQATKVASTNGWRTLPFKDKADLFFKLIGLVALATPIYLFVAQQKSQVQREKAIAQINLYSELTTSWNILFSQNELTSTFDSMQSIIDHTIIPKAKIHFDKNIIYTIGQITLHAQLYKLHLQCATFEDSLTAFFAGQRKNRTNIKKLLLQQDTDKFGFTNTTRFAYEGMKYSDKFWPFRREIIIILDSLRKTQDRADTTYFTSSKLLKECNYWLDYEFKHILEHYRIILLFEIPIIKQANRLYNANRDSYRNSARTEYHKYLMKKLEKLDQMIIKSNWMYKTKDD